MVSRTIKKVGSIWKINPVTNKKGQVTLNKNWVTNKNNKIRSVMIDYYFILYLQNDEYCCLASKLLGPIVLYKTSSWSTICSYKTQLIQVFREINILYHGTNNTNTNMYTYYVYLISLSSSRLSLSWKNINYFLNANFQNGFEYFTSITIYRLTRC